MVLDSSSGWAIGWWLLLHWYADASITVVIVVASRLVVVGVELLL